MRTFADPAGAIDVTAGEPFAVQLPVNATTGYEWHVQSGAEAGPHVVGVTFEVSSAPLVGASGHQRLTLRVDRPGTHHVRIVLARSWEVDRVEDARELVVRAM